MKTASVLAKSRASLRAGKGVAHRTFWKANAKRKQRAATADERVVSVKFTRDTLSVSLRDGRTITVPLAWYPRLLNASPAERRNWRIAGGGYGIHWPDIDEDLSTEGLLRGAPAPRPTRVENPAKHKRRRTKRRS